MEQIVRNGTRPLTPATIREFSSKLHGEVVWPGSPDYETARLVWNGMIDKRPALIVRCADAEDVVLAVNVAREHGLLVAVRGGGHNVAGLGTCDGGMVIDLSRMNEVTVDPERRIARAGGGARWADVDAATQAHGLATPGGVVSDTGIAGLTLGGGLGWLARTYGLSADNLIAADVVTADGRTVRASETENPDLLWGLRGGGGNFGIVTAFEFRLHPVGPEVMASFVFHDAQDAGRMEDLVRFFRDFTASAPDEANVLCALGQVPPGAEAFPEEHWGKPFVAYLGVYAGPVEEGRRILAPLREIGTPLADHGGVMPFVQAQKMLDEDYPAHTMRYYWKSLYLRALSDDAISKIVEQARRQPSPYTTIDIWHLGGAISRVPEDATAFSGRSAPYGITAEANWVKPEDDEANVSWGREVMVAMTPFSDGNRYLNFPGFYEEGDDMMKGTFKQKYAKLAELKRKYDPTNLFQLNHNIKP